MAGPGGDAAPPGPGCRVGVVEERRRELHAFRERGGRVVAYLLDPVDSRSYYLACAADEILATPPRHHRGDRAPVPGELLKDALDRVGLEAEGRGLAYKSAATPTSETTSLKRLASRPNVFSTAATKSWCGRSPGEETSPRRRVPIDGGPYAAPDALGRGCLDAVCYEDELPARLGGERRGPGSEWEAARRSLRVPYRRSARRRVGLVSLGDHSAGAGAGACCAASACRLEQAGSDAAVAALRRAEKTGAWRPSSFTSSRRGRRLASDLIWREVERLRATKPVVVLMGNVAASGGYYVSAAANHVVARSGTVTGSRGPLDPSRRQRSLREDRGSPPPCSAALAQACSTSAAARPPTSCEYCGIR